MLFLLLNAERSNEMRDGDSFEHVTSSKQRGKTKVAQSGDASQSDSDVDITPLSRVQYMSMTGAFYPSIKQNFYKVMLSAIMRTYM